MKHTFKYKKIDQVYLEHLYEMEKILIDTRNKWDYKDIFKVKPYELTWQCTLDQWQELIKKAQHDYRTTHNEDFTPGQPIFAGTEG